MRKRRTIAVLGIAVAALGGTAACSSSGPSGGSGGGSGGGGSIVVGSVNTLSGAVTFPEASQAAKAVFDKVNASGGINGKKIKYIALDDKGDPSTAAQDARKLVADGAVALDGSASLLDCEVNGAYYKSTGISSIPGVGVDPGCFASKAIAPANVGPYLGTQVILQYGSQQLHLHKICAFFSIIAGTQNAYKQAVTDWSKQTGQALALDDTSIPEDATDFTPYALHAKRLGCDGVFMNGTQPLVVPFANAMASQHMDKTVFLTLSSTYTIDAAKALGNVPFPMYSSSEFAPYTSGNDSANSDWRALMTADKIPLTSFSQGGYLAATYLVQVLKTMKGPITQKSVTHALQTMKPLSNPMAGTPWVFGTGATHNPNHSIKVVKLVNGTWSTANPKWIVAATS